MSRILGLIVYDTAGNRFLWSARMSLDVTEEQMNASRPILEAKRDQYFVGHPGCVLDRSEWEVWEDGNPS